MTGTRRLNRSQIAALYFACAACCAAVGCNAVQKRSPDCRLLYFDEEGSVEAEPLLSLYHHTETRPPIGIRADEATSEMLLEARESMTIEALDVGIVDDPADHIDALIAVSQMREIKNLDIRGVAPGVLSWLGQLPQLRRFSYDIPGQCSTEGLHEFLSKHGSLESLCLQGRIGTEGFAILRATPQLREFHWRPGSHTCCDDDLRHLRHVPELRELRLSPLFPKGHLPVTDEGLRHLRVLPELRHLTLDSDRITDEGLRHLAELLNLESLEMPLEAPDLQHLGKMRRLRTLVVSDGLSYRPDDLDHLDFKEENLTFLADAESLISLQLPYGAEVTDSSAAALARMKKLKQLIIPSSALTPAGYQVLFDRADPPIVHLQISLPNAASDDAIDVLAARSSVEYLEISSGKISAEGFRRLSQLKSLRYLNLLFDCKFESPDVLAFARSRPDVFVQADCFVQGKRVVKMLPPFGRSRAMTDAEVLEEFTDGIARKIRSDDAFVQSRLKDIDDWKKGHGLR